jgi:capsular polysaccharide transport system ATP-binding protein
MSARSTAVARRPPDQPLAVERAHLQPQRPVRSISVQRVVKEYHTPVGVRRVLDGISFDLPEGEKIGVVGRNGSGKSTLVKLIGGVEFPTSGTIRRDLSLSWPLGFSGGITGHMTGAAGARFIARLYNRDEGDVLAFVDDFAELGRQLFIPIDAYSSGMRARLMFALTLAVDFECFLIDEVFSVGDQRFHRKCHDALFVKRADRAMVLVSHDQNIIRTYCRSVLVLKAGRGRVFEDLELALRIYETL